MAKTHKESERRVARYLGCPVDEHGSRRAWKELYDLEVVGNDGRTWRIEIKSHRWRRGPKALRTLLVDAWSQLAEVCWQANAEGPRAVIYRPTGIQEANALAYCQLDGQMVVMFLDDFRQRFLEKEEST